MAGALPLRCKPEGVQAGRDELDLPIARTVINNSGVPGATNIGRQWLARTLARDPWEGGRMVQQYQVILMKGNASKTSETYGKAKAVEFDDTGKSQIGRAHV